MPDTSEIEADMAFFPAPDEVRQRVLLEVVDFEVWPENWDALELFLRLQTQWKTGAMGGIFGLDYAGLEAVMRMLGIEQKEEMFAKIQVMEFAALPVLNKKKD